MERVNDIIDELQIQLDPLKEQSKKASIYLDIKEKLQNTEVALLATQITLINSEYQKNKEKIEEFNSQIMNLNVKTNKVDSELLEYKSNVSKIEFEIKTLNDELLSLTKEEERIRGEKSILKERSKYDASDSKIYENISNLTEQKKELENDIYGVNKDIDNLTSDCNLLKEELNKNILSLENSRGENIKLYNELSNKKIELSDVTHRISITEDYINSGGTSNNSIKSILNNPRLSGIHKTLGNLINADEKYLKALDIALGASKQFIVVDTTDNAKNAINYLKDNRLGRATFFPMDVIKPRGIDLDTMDIVKSCDGFIAVLSDVLTYDKIYHNVVTNQLGNVILTDNIDSATKISKKIYQKYKVVSLDGDVVHVGGTMSGGSSISTKSIFTEKQELSRLKTRKDELDELINSLQQNIKDNSLKIEKIEEIRNKKQVELLSIEGTINSKKNSLASFESKLNDVNNELSNLNSVTNSSISKEEERLTNEFYSISRQREDKEHDIKQKEKEKDKLNSLILESDASNKLNNSTLYSYEKELKKLEIANSKMDIELDNKLNILSEDYELTYERARDNYVLDEEIDIAVKKVDELKTELKKIGMVNIDSIADYKRVSERYEFLTSQKKDLENAKDTLLEIIEEMDTVMKEEFLSAFNKIKVEFEKVFKELFKGGHATLELTDPKNILETGVDIIASPPGKKLTSISLLSGGEKTLTAICLIFAILNVKTVPFCLFDEVEAALDEANVDNFGKYLNNYRDKTQFLIITHKKKTMEYANTLYGITMQESGVSKLVSVKLENIKN